MYLTWLGQAGFYLICDHGVRIMIDPYLSDSLFLKNGASHKRQVPVDERFLNVELDVMILTHTHGDHMDFMTLDRLFEKNPGISVLGPRNVLSLLRDRFGFAEEWMLFEPGTEITIHQVLYRAAFAMHSDLCPIGVIINDGEKQYCHTGDTMYHVRLLEDYPKSPELLLLPMNGKGNNMNAEDAARLTQKLKPKHVFPMHWDMFASYSGDVDAFANCLSGDETDILRIPQFQEIEL